MSNLKKRRFLELQSLKAIAAIMVFFSHALNMKNGGVVFHNVIGKSFHFFWDGSIGVVIFFVLSGFLVPISIKKSDAKSFLIHIIKKIIRLYPVYIITLIMAWIFCNMQVPFEAQFFSEWFAGFWNHKVSFGEVCPLFLIPALTNALTLNPPIWTLYVEWIMIFVMPLVLWAYRKFNKILVLLLCIGGGGYFGWYISVPYMKFEFVPMFAVGMYLCLEREKIRDRTQKPIYWSILFLVIGCCLMNIHNIYGKINEFKYYGFTQFIIVIGFSIIIWTVFSDKRIAGCLKNKYLIGLGDISYEIYLTHFIVLLLLRPLKSKLGWEGLIILALILTLLISWGLHNAIGKRIDQVKALIKAKY